MKHVRSRAAKLRREGGLWFDHTLQFTKASFAFWLWLWLLLLFFLFLGRELPLALGDLGEVGWLEGADGSVSRTGNGSLLKSI